MNEIQTPYELYSYFQNLDAPVIIVPSLQVGELLLFLKYLYSNKVEEMFNKEDVGVIENVCQILDIDMKIQSVNELSQDLGSEIIEMHHPRGEPQTEISQPEIKDDKIFRERRIREQEKIKTKLSCKFCDEVIPFTLLSKHVRQKHPEKEICCLICEVQCETRKELEDHLQDHQQDNVYYLSCERCGRVVLSQYQLQMHRKTHNIKNLNPVKCPLCEKVFQIRDKLNRHIKLHESGELDKKFPCEKCNKKFSKQYDLARHLKSHNGIKTHFCDICGDKFVDGTRLKQHKWIHSNHKGLKCPVEECGQSFRLKSHLTSHLASLHPRSPHMTARLLQCPHCRRSFAYEYKLKQHLDWHNLDLAQRVECDATEYNIINMNIIDHVEGSNHNE